MTASSARHAYVDCFEVMDRALADDRGVRVKFDDYGDAMHFRIRCHCARRIDRQANQRLYEEDHPMYGQSLYDTIVVRVKRDGDVTWVNLERLAIYNEVESLSEPSQEAEA